MTRTLVVGLDAATWQVAEPLLEDDDLPNISNLCAGGTVTTLNSTTVPMTPPAWTSMVTGVNPGKHGVFDFVEQDHSTYKFKPESTRLSRPAIWDLFNAGNRDCIFVNFPNVFPPLEIDSVFISGTPAPDSESIAHPQTVQDHLAKTGYQRRPYVQPEDDPERYLQEVEDITDQQCNLVCWLLEQYDPELVWTVFMGIDWVQHHLWHEEVNGEDAVNRIYRQMDEVLGRLVEETGDDWNVLVVSDHGQRPIDSEIHLNSLLENEGFLSQPDSDAGPLERATHSVKDIFWTGITNLPVSIKRAAKQRLSRETIRTLREFVGRGQQGMETQIDWSETQAFAYGTMGQVYIHVADRYPKGTVDRDEYEHVRKQLAEALRSAKHPETGESLFAAVRPGETVYKGQYTEEGPDLVCEPVDWRYSLYGDLGNPWIHAPKRRVADHEPCGLFVFSGPDVTPRSADVEAVDIAPTLLHLHGLAVPADADGSLIQEVLRDPGEIKTIDPSKFNSIDTMGVDDVDSTVEERLSDLGYM